MPAPVPPTSAVSPGGLILPPGVAVPPVASTPPAPTPFTMYPATPPVPNAQGGGIPMPNLSARQAPRMFGTGGGSMQNLTPRGTPTNPAAQAQATVGRLARERPPYTGPTSRPVGKTRVTSPGGGAQNYGMRPPPPSAPTAPISPVTSNPMSGRLSWMNRQVGGSGWKGRAAGGAAGLLTGIGTPLAVNMALDGRDITSTPYGRVTGALGEGLSMGAMAGGNPSVAAGTGLASAAGQTGVELDRFARDDSNPMWQRALSTLADAGLESNPLTGPINQGFDILNDLTGGDEQFVTDMIPGLDKLGIDAGRFSGRSGGGQDEQDAAAAQAEQAAALRASLPDTLTSLGVSEQSAAIALDQLEQDIALMRLQAENGLLVVEGENGEPVQVTPDQVDQLAMDGFIQSTIPELIDMQQQQQDAMARAAAFQAAVGDVMAPYQQEANALADLYPQMFASVPNVAPELAGPLQNLGNIYGAGARSQANAYGAMGQMIPMQMAMDERQALQAQIDQMLMQQALRDQGQSGAGGDPSTADTLLGS